MISNLFIEITNILVVCCTPDPLDLIGNFVALIIICQIDDFVLSTIHNEGLVKILDADEFCSEVFKVKHTTSKKCEDTLMTEDDEPRAVRINFS